MYNYILEKWLIMPLLCQIVPYAMMNKLCQNLCWHNPLVPSQHLLSCLLEDEERGALSLLFHLLCIQLQKGDADIIFLFSQHEVKTKTFVNDF